MKRTISSTEHSVFKIIVLFFTVMGGVMIIGGSFDLSHLRWDMLPMVGLWALFLWFSLSRKTVQMDDCSLYVSVFRRVVAIPLAQISGVTESIGVRDRSVTVHFRSATPCGRSITFSPTLLLTRNPHPIVAELLAYARVEVET